MCEFISWIEKEKELFYLTLEDLKGKRFNEFKKGNLKWIEDLPGHGAILHFYPEADRGVQKECIDFSNPINFPDEIVNAIKMGEFRGIGVCPAILIEPVMAWYDKFEQSKLSEYRENAESAKTKYNKIEQPASVKYEKNIQPAKTKYEKIRQSAWDEYKNIVDPVLDKYMKINMPGWNNIKRLALAEYEKVKQNAWAEYDKVNMPASVEYENIRQPERAEYNRIEQPALAEYEKIKHLAKIEYERAIQATFWDLAVKPENRTKRWK